MNKGNIDFVLFRQAVYNSWYKLLIGIAIIIGLLWAGERYMATHAAVNAQQRLAQLRQDGPPLLMTNEEWRATLKKAEQEAYHPEGLLSLAARVLMLMAGVFGIAGGWCALRICLSGTKEHEAYCNALGLPFMRAYIEYLKSVR